MSERVQTVLYDLSTGIAGFVSCRVWMILDTLILVVVELAVDNQFDVNFFTQSLGLMGVSTGVSPDCGSMCSSFFAS